MKRFKNILVVLNDVAGDDETLAQAVALAQKNNAVLTIAAVIEDVKASSEYTTEREEHLFRLASSLAQDNVSIHTVVLNGTPFLEIIRQVMRNDHDMVMMTAEGDVGYAQLFFGSTSLHLIRKCPCPVWLTKPEAHNDYARIMAAVDLDCDGSSESELNITIMDLATSLARLNDAKLYIAHAWEVSGKDRDTLKSEITDEIENWILHTHEMNRRRKLDLLLDRYELEDVNHVVHLMRGAPEYVLPQLADTSQIDLIVMGTIGRSGIPGFFIGNSAELMLRQVQCSVLAVKPENFVTPVTLS